uniref:EOG090X0MWD n=1 Tax=Eubosmina coregoni TaxID=186181 RepID=A0A4Y7LSD6_9CRUS|nr:EOG090X0MWD [Eubosmina coregoni]SVE70223.1 EOG090X0MWD [Eubosmina coregoni]
MTDSEKELSNQIQHYERFLNEVLRTKLRECLNARETFITDIHDYLQLKKSLENFNEIDTEPLKTKVDLGCGFFVQGKVTDVSKVFVSVGFGFNLELTHAETFTFIEKKVELLNQRVKALEEEAIQINTDIKLMLGTLAQLQNLVPTTSNA